MRFLVCLCVVVSVTVTARQSESGLKKIWQILLKNLDVFKGKDNMHLDTGANISQFLKNHHYLLEAYDVTTEDGYILTLHRIPHGRADSFRNGTGKPAVLLVHGLACSAIDWVWQGPNKSLALNLADLGYDVWLANTRGNAHSMRHRTLSDNSAAFWDFSFHEKGYYDVPSLIDFVLDRTQMEKLTYIGHSQGTTEAIVLTSSKVEYNDKIDLMVLLSPIVYMEHLASPIVKIMQQYTTLIETFSDLFGIYGLPYFPQLRLLTNLICNEYSLLQGICIFILELFCGFDREQIDKTNLTVFLSNVPSGVSLKELKHYNQEIHSGKFRMYDYGNRLANMKRYGSAVPSSYNISQITVPMAIYYAKNDYLAAIEDVERFMSELNVKFIDRYLIEYENFNHLDFIIAKDVKALLYDRVIDVINKYKSVAAH